MSASGHVTITGLILLGDKLDNSRDIDNDNDNDIYEMHARGRWLLVDYSAEYIRGARHRPRSRPKDRETERSRLGYQYQESGAGR